MIKCIYRGKSKKEASHFISLPRTQWLSEEIKELAEIKSQNRKKTRVNLSSTRVKLSETRVKLTHKDTVRNLKETENLIKNSLDSNTPSRNLPTPSKKKPRGSKSPVPPPDALKSWEESAD